MSHMEANNEKRDHKDVHWAIYKSYVTEEYKDYILSVKAERNSEGNTK